jgi:PAS domain S-box-containing protein
MWRLSVPRAVPNMQTDATAPEAEIADDLIDDLPGVVFRLELSPAGEFRFDRISPSTATLLGVSATDIAREADVFFGRAHPDDLPGLLDSLHIAGRERSPWQWLGRLESGSRGLRWIRGQANVKTKPGGLIVFSGVLLDSTEEGEEIDHVRRSRERFELAVNGSSAGIWDWEVGSDRVYLSPRWKEMLGYSDQELLNRFDTWKELMHAEDRPRVMEAIDSYLQGRSRDFEVEYRMWHRNATCRWVLARGAALRDPSGKPYRMAGSHTDLTAWKHAEERLRLLESAIFHATDAVIITEAEPISRQEPRIVYVNEAFCRQTGYRPEEAVGKTSGMLQGPGTDQATLDQVRGALETLSQITVELLNYRKDGTDFWVEFSLVPIADKSGLFTHWVSVQRDISERKKTEAVQEAFLSLGLLLSSAASQKEAASIVANEADRILGWDAFGLMVWDAEKRLLSDVLQLELVDGNRAELPLTLNRPLSALFERVVGSGTGLLEPDERPSPGSAPGNRTMSTLLVPIRRGPEAFGLVTIRSGHHGAYRESDLVTLQAMADYAAAAIERMQAQQDLRQANESLEERVHLRTEQIELTNRLMRMEISERQRIERELETERRSLSRQVEERTRSLSQANVELAKVATLKDEFLASMSHELRTPLNSVLGLSEALLEEVYGPLTEKQRGSLNGVTESGRHLLALINDILDLSKIEAGKMKLDAELFTVRDVCESSLRFIKEIAQKKRIGVTLNIGDGVDQLTADERRVKQMLVNLLSNAVKFTPEGGRVGIDVHAVDDPAGVRFEVWDTGIGIVPSNQDKLFRSFVQLDSSLSREYCGTGLGLALVRRMAELHGGRVGLESDLGKGSRFHFFLPAVIPTSGPDDTRFVRRSTSTKPEPSESVDLPQRPQTPAVPMESSLAPPGLDQPLILVADDNETNTLLLRDYLEQIGYRMIFASDGQEAVDRTIAEHPDLVLMDVQMPNKDGLEAMREIRATPGVAHTPMIALTALAMSGDRERCLAAGANDYLTKPVSLKGLVLAMKRLLEKAKTAVPSA